jgi:phospholipase C
MGVYVDDQLIYVVDGTTLNTSLNVSPGGHNTVVEEWDYCGGASYDSLNILVSGQTGVVVTTPAPNATVTSPVTYAATASTSTCAAGVAAMGIYINNVLKYLVSGAKLNTQLNLASGAEHTVVEEWDNCGGAAFTTINLTVQSAAAAPQVSMSADPASLAAGSSSVLTVAATGATKVSLTGTDGSIYSLPANGGTETVSPTQTVTYTADATGPGGSASASATVSVIPASSAQAIQHVIFMLQENHSFDNYFGMLNPYRHTNGWDIGDDGKEYDVDGIDDKLTTISNQDDEGTTYNLFKLATTCIDDASSSWLESYGDVSRWNFTTTRPIAMDGFVHIAEGYAKNCASSGTCSGAFTDTTGERAMGYYDESFLNYYYYMASQFAVSDRWFSPVSSKSIPNRLATASGGTTQGLVFDPGNDDHLAQLDIETLYQELDQANVSWKIYYSVTDGFCVADDECSGSADANYPATTFSTFSYSYRYLYENPSQAACVAPTQPSSVVGDTSNSFCIDPTHIAPLNDPKYGYFGDLTSGTLRSYSFIEAGSGVDDEHPGSGQSILLGQAEVATILNAFMDSPEWKNSVFFLSYDESGGPYDHVPPVPGHSNENTDSSLGAIPDISSIAVNADSFNPCVPASGTPTLHCDLYSSDPGANAADAAAVQGFAAQLGFRVPNMVISPFTRRHYVSHIPMDHTAVIKFVENRFIGPSAHLTARDAAQSNLLDFFDFTNTPWATPPAPPAPVTAQSLGYNPCMPQNLAP